MSKYRIVTGYIPLKNHTRSAEEYGRLGEDIFGKLDCGDEWSIQPFYEPLPETWLFKLARDIPRSIEPSIADNPAKNTIGYHCTNHQKFGWLLKSAMADPSPETFVWIDYGIGHVPGVTATVIQEFMAKVKTDDFAIPGCWTREFALEHANYNFPNWRFCGGLMVVPRGRIHKLYKAIKQEAGNHMRTTGNMTWEVNSLANVEKSLPGLRWYQADHNETMFTNYGATNAH